MLALSLVGARPQHFPDPSASAHVTPVRRHGGSNPALCTTESVTDNGCRSPALGRETYPNDGHLVLPRRACMPGFVEMQNAYGLYFIFDQVVKSLGGICVDEAVADPLRRLDAKILSSN